MAASCSTDSSYQEGNGQRLNQDIHAGKVPAVAF